MEKFSHDLTVALEEAGNRCTGSASRWGIRRRTRSTGNLPCAPLPTEDSSSAADGANAHNADCGPNDVVLSDSDDRGEFKFTLNSRPDNIESDSLNENFSPTTRTNARRKRKFKRMAVEYDMNPQANPPVPNLFGAVKKRVLKNNCQENFRANLFFCGKRKRSHRDRYDYDHKQHSSSVPRQTPFGSRNSYLEYKSRGRSGFGKPGEKIQPLNKTILSKIEKISQDFKAPECQFMPIVASNEEDEEEDEENSNNSAIPAVLESSSQSQPIATGIHPAKSNSLESNFSFQEYGSGNSSVQAPTSIKERKSKESKRHHRHKQMDSTKMQLQFDDPTFMDCIEDFLSSSSLSSSESEGEETCDSDREGDDELTDWPGNEVMINFASKNDFKRARSQKLIKQSTLPLIKSDDVGQEDDTLMSGDDLHTSSAPQTQPGFVQFNSSVNNVPPPKDDGLLLNKNISSLPINIANNFVAMRPQIESEMSGETSNHFLSSPNAPNEVREIRAGCRRVREERPSFSIITSVNEDLSRFLQDGKQTQLRLPDTDALEHEKLSHLATLYSLHMKVDNGYAILTKTSNTTQTVRIERRDMSRRFLNDFKRRCYDHQDVKEFPS